VKKEVKKEMKKEGKKEEIKNMKVEMIELKREKMSDGYGESKIDISKLFDKNNNEYNLEINFKPIIKMRGKDDHNLDFNSIID